MDFINYRQHPKFGTVCIQMNLKDNKFSVLKMNGESLTADGCDLTPVSIDFKLDRYINAQSGIYSEDLSRTCKFKLALILLKQDTKNDIEKMAEQLELTEELNEYIEA